MAPSKLAPPRAPRLACQQPCPNPVTDANRIIGKHRLYDLKSVKDLVQKHGAVVLNDETIEGMSGRGENPLPLPEWVSEDVAGVILALTDDDFENSQWCLLNTNKYLDCDSYVIYYKRSKKTRGTGPSGCQKLYVKFGFSPNATTPCAVVCRLHPADH